MSATALVTGASSGLGRAYARALAARGHGLLLVARREPALQDLAGRLRAHHAVPVRVLTADLATDEGLARCRAAMDASPPRVAVLNAGFGSVGPLVLQDREREDRMVRLNCLAVTDLAHHALRGMVAAGRGGSLVVVSSAAAFQPLPRMAVYAATKAFELHLAEALAREGEPHGIGVVAVCPGPTRTEFADALRRDGGDPGARTRWPWWTPVDEPDDVVAATWRALARGRPRVATGAVARLAQAGTALPRPLVVTLADALHRLRGAAGGPRRGEGDRRPV